MRLKLFSFQGQHCQTALRRQAAQCRLHKEELTAQLAAVSSTNTETTFVKKADMFRLSFAIPSSTIKMENPCVKYVTICTVSLYKEVKDLNSTFGDFYVLN